MARIRKHKFVVGDIVYEILNMNIWKIIDIRMNTKFDYKEYIIQKYGTEESKPWPCISVDTLCKKATKAQIILYGQTSL